MVRHVKMLENFPKLSGLKRYRWPLLVLAIGVLLLLLPSGGKTEQRAVEETVETDGFDLEAFTDQLEALLGNMQGVGRVQLLLSLEDGGETIYQMDLSQTQSTDSSQNQSQTVLARTGSSDLPVAKCSGYPGFRGAVVLCQGAGRPEVQLAVKEAVSSLTGLGMDHITVCAME